MSFESTPRIIAFPVAELMRLDGEEITEAEYFALLPTTEL